MTLASKIGEMNRLRSSEAGAAEFTAMVKFILANGGKFSLTAMRAEEKKLANIGGHGLSMRSLEILKHVSGGELSRAAMQRAAQTPGALAGSGLQDFSAISSGFVNSLASAGAFDRMLADGALREVPLQSGSVGAITVGATAYQVLEGQLKPISRLTVSGFAQNPLKVHTALVITQELARSPSLASGQLIQRELRNSIAIATDAAFIGSIIAGVIPASSFGSNGTAARQDIEWLLRQVGLKQTSRPYLLTTSAIAGTLSQKDNSGQAAFPELGPLGGTISGIPVLVSDAVPLGYLILLDASMVAAAGGEVMLEEVEDGILQLDTSPDSPVTGSTPMVGLWQSNLTGIRCERFIVAQKLIPTAVAIINSPLSYIAGAGSP